MSIIKRIFSATTPVPVPTPLDEQLIDVARALISSGHRDLASDVSDVIELSRGDISGPLHGVFEDLLISLDWAEMDPDEDETAEIRATLALIHKVGGR
jgi:hypothetical protein